MSRFEIPTARLVLTPLGVRFLDTVNEYALDAETTRYMIHLPNESPRETLAFLQGVEAEWEKEQPDAFKFALLFQGKHVGTVNIHLSGGAGELGWIVNRRYWGRGFATEAARALVDHFAAHFAITHFIAHCDADNTASWRIMEKLGMERTGTYSGRQNRSAAHDSTEYRYDLWR